MGDTTDASVRSAASTDAPVPQPPFWGAREIDVAMDDVYHHLDTHVLFKLHWGGRGVKGEAWRKLVDEDFRPRLERMWREASYLRPQAKLGYFPCYSEGNEVVVLDPDDRETVLERLVFPRQPKHDRICLADFYRPKDSAELDVVALQAVTAGDEVTELMARLEADGEFAEQLFVHGLGVQTAEGIAEWLHACVRRDLGIALDQGRRYSWGYPACPEQSEHEKVFRLLDAESIGLRLSGGYAVEPEQSTIAIVAHHPQAVYFGMKSGFLPKNDRQARDDLIAGSERDPARLDAPLPEEDPLEARRAGHERQRLDPGHVDDRQQAPFAGDAGERPPAAVGEFEPGARDEVVDGLGHEHLARCGLGGDSLRDLNGDAANAIASDFNLARMHAGAGVEAERPERAHDRRRAADRARGAVERGERPVARRLELMAAEPGQLSANHLVVALDELEPGTVAALGGRLRRTDDLGDEQRHQGSIPVHGERCRAAFGEERLDGVEDLIRVDRDEVIGSGQLDEAGAGDPLGDVATFLDPHVEVGAAVHDESRDADRRQQRADVDPRVHLHQRLDCARAGGGAATLAPPARHRLVGRGAHALHVGLEGPVALQSFDVGGPHLSRRRPGVVVVGVDPFRVCPVEDERARPLGIGRGEEDRHRRALGVPEQDGAAAVDRIHDRAHVVHARLEVGHAGWPVGQTGAALVEPDQACDRAEPFEEVRVARLLPVLLEVGDEAGEEYEVDRPVAGHLVGDAEVATARIPDRRASRGLGPRAGPRTRSGQVQARILTEDAQLELPERRPGVDAELLDQRPASALERVQRVGLPAAAVQREHQLAAQALAKRVLRDERLELRHQLVMAAERQLSVDAIFDRRETELLEPGDLALRERLVSQLGQRLPAPERKRLAQAGRPLLRIVALSRLGDQRLEPRDVDLAGRDPQEIAGRARPDPIGADQLA